MYSPRTAAVNFMVELCRCRAKENMPKLMAFFVQIFNRCREIPPHMMPHAELGGRASHFAPHRTPSNSSHSSVYIELNSVDWCTALPGGALLAIGSLQDKLKGTPGYKEQIEPMLAAHVLPAFASAHGRAGR